jgi:hypothetical protein
VECVEQELDSIVGVKARSFRVLERRVRDSVKTLTFDAAEHAWGFNVSRYIQRKLEEDPLGTRLVSTSHYGKCRKLAS